jgi:hypothetical protein
MPPDWTSYQTECARVLFTEHASAEQFLMRIGRTKAAAHSHLYYLDNKQSILERRSPYRKERREKIALGIISARVENKVSSRPTFDMVLDARRRATAPRSIIAWLAGDPAPGQSALDKRNRSNEQRIGRLDYGDRLFDGDKDANDKSGCSNESTTRSSEVKYSN